MNKDAKTKGYVSISTKLYIFIIATVLAVAFGISFLAYRISAEQIDKYYKKVSYDSAQNFASMVDGNYIAKLRKVAEGTEYQEIRNEAEETENDNLVQEYLEKENLWSEYKDIKDKLQSYIENMSSIEYLYIVACGGPNDTQDMYLIDDYTTPLSELGYYEEREEAFYGVDFTKRVEPIISTGDWGWLCSAYAPIYDSNGKVVAQVGCDFGMSDVMNERRTEMFYIIGTAFLLTIIVLAIAVMLIDNMVVKPLDKLTVEMKKFKPENHADYADAGIVNININSNDEINELYDGIRAMQINIIDYLNDVDRLQKDKEKAEKDIQEKEEQIGQISKEAYQDALTGVSSKTAYVKTVGELNKEIENGNKDIAVVMIDMNNLKGINDEYGHKLGDLYIKGCTHMICDTFKHSLVFRIGGDEFIAILKDDDYDNRYKLVNDLKQKFMTSAGNKKEEPWNRYSAAVGMAEYSSENTTVDLIFKQADRVMYENKKQMKKELGGAEIR